MNETTAQDTPVQTDLDRLSARVEKAAAIVQQLRDDRSRLEQERENLTRRVQELEQKLQGHDPSALVAEIGTLRREQRDWTAERREVASRIESLVKKLERLE
jgi:chromosome segregation ATPase